MRETNKQTSSLDENLFGFLLPSYKKYLQPDLLFLPGTYLSGPDELPPIKLSKVILNVQCPLLPPPSPQTIFNHPLYGICIFHKQRKFSSVSCNMNVVIYNINVICLIYILYIYIYTHIFSPLP